MNDKNNEVLKQHFKTTSKEVKRACTMAKSKREEKLELFISICEKL